MMAAQGMFPAVWCLRHLAPLRRRPPPAAARRICPDTRAAPADGIHGSDIKSMNFYVFIIDWLLPSQTSTTFGIQRHYVQLQMVWLQVKNMLNGGIQ
jgi:hypothetical protein